MTRRRPLEWMANSSDGLGPGSASSILFTCLTSERQRAESRGAAATPWSGPTNRGGHEPYLVLAGSFSYELVTCPGYLLVVLPKARRRPQSE